MIDVLGVDVAYVKLDQGNQHLPRFRVTESRGNLGARFKGLIVAPGQGLAGLVARAGRAMAVRDYLSAKWISDDFAGVIEEEGLRAIACAPIPAPDGTLGLLSVGFRSVCSFDEQAISLLEDIANCTGIAMHEALASAHRAELERLNERQRLATELHDSVAQSIFAIGVEVNRPRNRQDWNAVQATMARIQTLAASASSELRNSLKAMSDAQEGFALESVIETEARQCEQVTGAKVKVIQRGERQKLPTLHEELICNAAREGLRNAVKHAKADLILIHLCFFESEVRVAIQSEVIGVELQEPSGVTAGDPAGTQEDSVEELHGGCGLHLLRTASRRCGGTLDLEFGGRGESTLTMCLPLNRY